MQVVPVDMFVMMMFFPMDHFFDETCLDQKRQCPINSRFGDSAPFFPKAIGEFFWFKMAFRGSGLPEDFLPSGRAFETLILEEV